LPATGSPDESLYGVAFDQHAVAFDGAGQGFGMLNFRNKNQISVQNLCNRSLTKEREPYPHPTEQRRYAERKSSPSPGLQKRKD
jgi:hypothetical protein